MAHVFETFRWLEGRTTPGETRNVVLGVEKLYPREMTRELLHIKGHLDTMLAMMEEGVVEIDQDHRILYANPAACRLIGGDDHQLFGKALSTFFDARERRRAVPRQRPVRHGRRRPPPRCRSSTATARCASPSRRSLDAEQLLRGAGHPQRRHRPGAPRALAARPDGGDRPARPGRALPARRRRDDPRGEPRLRQDPAPARGPRRHRHLAARLPRRHGTRAGVAAARRSPTRPAGETRNVEFTTAVFPERVVLTTSATVVDTAEGGRDPAADRGRHREGRHGARPAAGERGAREGQPRQEHVPLDGLPRTAHAALGGARLPLADPRGQDRPGPRAHPGGAAGRRQAGAPPAAPDRGASRPLADRVRAPLAAQGADRGGQARARGRRDVPRRPGPQEAVDRDRDPRRRCPTRWRTTTRSTRSSRTSCRTP